ncbi:uncharacterized protein BJ171DRAFT_440316 [Polychytrium aggregatum]|uniref:uncharacterized protein n=1 Tax=Polychytrium aggregatum TaxID=110093 RepID=UPI0022FEB163|nr:uncharacterized protein BJ171DRAFT_440316 [Polychytrium aggregatum]KAI9206798.1 hypothetical protein BJ171DRAFT_440316 [Polychytrium aggregatum]
MNAIDKYLLSPLVGAECSQSLLKLDTSRLDCFKLFISKCLGIGIVTGGAIVKLPQVIKIFMAQSAKGVSLTSYSLETVAQVIHWVYNYRGGNPFSTYGEAAFISITSFIVVLQILFYQRKLRGMGVVSVAFLLFSLFLSSPDLCSRALLAAFQWSSMLISIASKVPQIYDNFKAKSTGQLSAVTLFLTFAGSVARIFTTLQEVNDNLILLSNVAACALNAMLALQIVIYYKKVCDIDDYPVDETSEKTPFLPTVRLPKDSKAH